MERQPPAGIMDRGRLGHAGSAGVGARTTRSIRSTSLYIMCG
jgi:hypothetical protein